MNISGVLVRTYPENIQSVWQELTKMQGVEVHASNDDGRMVVTVEQENVGALSELLISMQDIPGVLSTSMIYHQFEDPTSADDEFKNNPESLNAHRPTDQQEAE